MRSQSYRTGRFADAADEDESSPGGGSHWRALLAPPLFRRPKDVLSLGLVVAATVVIVINALFLQAGPHPAPIFANPPRPAASADGVSTAVIPRPRPAELDRSVTVVPMAGPGNAAKPVPSAKASTVPAPPASDPIAELLEPSTRLMAVQRALAEFGYGQIKPTGVSGPETKAAIEKFERERKLPVTGQMSERLARELTLMKGGPL